VFSTCVDSYYGEAWNVLECEETFACAREVVGICDKDFLSEITVVSDFVVTEELGLDMILKVYVSFSCEGLEILSRKR
jgi:hypothetical protein